MSQDETDHTKNICLLAREIAKEIEEAMKHELHSGDEEENELVTRAPHAFYAILAEVAITYLFQFLKFTKFEAIGTLETYKIHLLTDRDAWTDAHARAKTKGFIT